MMTPEQRKEFRMQIASTILRMQETEQAIGTPIDIFIPELIGALMSLAADISVRNAGLSRMDFLKACEVTADEQWPLN